MKKFSNLFASSWNSKRSKRDRSQGRSQRKALLGSAVLSLILASQTPAWANPSGPTVKHGQVNITPGLNTQIQQLTEKAIIDWQSFSIGPSEAVQFLQPSDLSVILNRVTGGDPSSILGQLRANGNVFLINSSGILFGPNSSVNVGGLVASTLDMTDQDFLSGNYVFTQDPNRELASVVNRGRITISDGGYAVLTGPNVINEGLIVARSGHVVLAAGERATLNLDGRDLVHFALDDRTSEGPVLLAPGMLSDSLAQTLGVPRNQRADSLIEKPDGSVYLANSSGTLVQGGTLSVDGRDGRDAGDILLNSSDVVILSEGSLTSASGLGHNSNGGEILVLSDMTNEVSNLTVVESGATLAATGGTTGDGGLIETSGDQVYLAGSVDIAASHGQGGRFLLDPPGDTFVVDDTFAGSPGPGETFVTDLAIESALAGGNFDLQSSGRLIMNVTGTSSTGDTGIQSSSTFDLLFDTTTLSGTEVQLGIDDIALGGNFSVDAVGDIDLGSATISSQSVSLVTQGSILGDGVVINTQKDPNDRLDGGPITMQGDSGIALFNAELHSVAPRTNTALSLTTLDSEIRLEDTAITTDLQELINDPTELFFGEEVSVDSGAADIYFLDLSYQGGGLDIRSSDGVIEIGNDDSPVPTIVETRGDTTIDAASGSVLLSNIYSGSDLSITGASIDYGSLSGAAISLNGGSVNQFSSGGNSINGLSVDIVGTDINLDDSDIRGESSVSIQGDTVSLDNATIQTSQSAPGPILSPFVQITTAADLDSNSTAVIRSSRVILEAQNGDIDVSLNTALPAVPAGDEVATRLTASATGGVQIRDIAPDGTGLGIDLARPSGAPGVSPLEASAIQAGGPIVLESSGKIGIGLGNSSTPDFGNALIRNTALGAGVTLIADGPILDQNSTALFSPTQDIISNQGGIELIAAGGVGEFNSTAEGRIDVEGSSLVVEVSDPNAPIRVASETTDLEFIDVVTSGGQISIQERSNSITQGVTISNAPVALGQPNVLHMTNSTVTPGQRIRISSTADLLIDNFNIDGSQIAILETTGGASIFNGDPTGSGPNIVKDGQLALRSDGAIGSVTDFLRLSGGSQTLSGGSGGIYINFDGDLALDPLDSTVFSGPLSSPPTLPSFVDFQADGDIVLEVQGNLDVNVDLVSNNSGVALEVAGPVNLAESITAAENTLVTASSLTAADGRLTGRGVGLSLATDFGDSADLVEVSAQNLAIGNTPGVSYFLQTGSTNPDVAWNDSLVVANKTVSGNRADTLLHNHSQDNIVLNTDLSATDRVTMVAANGNVEVAGTLNGGNRAEVQAGGNITQSGSGLIESPSVLLDAGGNIGDLNSDQQVKADTLAAAAGLDAYVRAQTGDLELVGDAALSNPTGAGGQYRVRVDNGDLEISTDIEATDAAFVTGTDLTINPQTTGSDIFLNGNVTSTGNLVLAADGDLVQGTGSLTVTGGGSLGLGSRAGSLGTSANPIVINTTNLTLSHPNGQFQAPSTPTPSDSTTAVGVTVNAQGTITPEPGSTEPGSTGDTISVEVVLLPNDLPNGQTTENLFAQDNVDLVEQDLAQIKLLNELLDEAMGPAPVPLDWWDDEDFLRHKLRGH